MTCQIPYLVLAQVIGQVCDHDLNLGSDSILGWSTLLPLSRHTRLAIPIEFGSVLARLVGRLGERYDLARDVGRTIHVILPSSLEQPYTSASRQENPVHWVTTYTTAAPTTCTATSQSRTASTTGATSPTAALTSTASFATTQAAFALFTSRLWLARELD